MRAAKRHGDFLIVSIARDLNVKRIKGYAPCYSEHERKKLLQSLKFVDKVVIGAKDDYIGHILKEKPRVIVLGYDQKEYTRELQKKLAKRGLKVNIKRMKPYKPALYKTTTSNL